MGDVDDDLTEAGEFQWELHLHGECDETECQYCMEEHWWDEDSRHER